MAAPSRAIDECTGHPQSAREVFLGLTPLPARARMRAESQNRIVSPRLSLCMALAAAVLVGGCALLPQTSIAAACRLDTVGTVGVSMLRNVPLVVARVNGTPLRFVLDTGSESTFLTSEAARRLNLRANPA